MGTSADLLRHPAILPWIAVDLAAIALLGLGVAGLVDLTDRLSTLQSYGCVALGLAGILVAAIKLVATILSLKGAGQCP